MPRKPQTKYGPGGQYYRKKIKGPDGKFISVYGKTLAELSEKVTLRQNELAAVETVPPGEQYFFEYAAAWYRRRAPHLSEQMRRAYQHEINDVICPVIGSKLIREISSDDLADVMATRADKSRSSQKKTVMVIKQIFDAALEAGVIDKLPSRRLRAEGSPPQLRRALTKEQEKALLQTVKGLPIEPFVMIALYAGLRREEILGLQWDCVDLNKEAPHIIVRRALRWPDNHKPVISEMLKTDAAARTVSIPDVLAGYLAEMRKAVKCKDEAKLLRRCVIAQSDGTPLTYSAFRSRWHAIEVRSTASGHELGAKIRNKKIFVTLDFPVTPHTLRHTYITRLILGGVDLKRVQYLAGHSDPKITIKIYTDLMGHLPEDMIGDVRRIFD